MDYDGACRYDNKPQGIRKEGFSLKLNRKWLLIASLVLSVALATGGTLAYLADTAEDVNVMTLGNVSIEQVELQRDAAGKLVDFQDNKPLYPAVGEIAWNDDKININGHDYNMFGDKLKNAVDKIVTVENTGKSDAYVRTIIAIEDPFTTSLLGVNVGGVGTTQQPWTSVKVSGVTYSVTVFTYDEALEPGEASLPSLLQVYLKSKATSEDCALLGDTFEIIAVSQAAQTNGFDSAAASLNAAFGEATDANLIEWLEDAVYNARTKVEVTGSDKAAVLAAINNAQPGDVVRLSRDTTIAGYDATKKLVIDKPIILDLNGMTLTTESGWGGIDLKNGASLRNGVINHTGNTAAIKAFNVGSIENVTINVTTSDKTKGGIVVQEGANCYIDSIKNVTITGATNGIECYRSTHSPAIGSMENVKIDATENGIYLNGAGQIGSISNCEIKGGSHGINAYLANLWHISLDITNSEISGGKYGIDIWDEGATNAGSTVTLKYDDKTTFTGGIDNIKVTLQEEITCTINGAQQTTPCDVRK